MGRVGRYTSARYALVGFVAAIGLGSVARAGEASQRAFTAKWAGSYDNVGFLQQQAVRRELQMLLGAELDHLLQNLNVSGAVDLSGETLSVSGNAPHQGTEEEAIVCVTVLPLETIVEAAVFSKGAIAVYSRRKQYDSASICVKDWITQVNSGHKDRFVQPANVQVTVPPRL